MKVKERLENSSKLKEPKKLNVTYDLNHLAIMNVIKITDET